MASFRYLRNVCLLFGAIFLVIGICYSKDSAQGYFDKGLKYAVEGRFKEAKKEFEAALKINPESESIKEAVQIPEDAIAQKIKREAAIRIFKGIDYLKKEKWDMAITEFNKAIASGADYIYAYANRGLAYVEKGKYDAAISDYNQTLKINPGSAPAYNKRSFAYYRKGDYNQAVSDAAQAININPNYADAYYNRGLARYFNRQYKEALADIEKAEALGKALGPAFLETFKKAAAEKK